MEPIELQNATDVLNDLIASYPGSYVGLTQNGVVFFRLNAANSKQKKNLYSHADKIAAWLLNKQTPKGEVSILYRTGNTTSPATVIRAMKTIGVEPDGLTFDHNVNAHQPENKAVWQGNFRPRPQNQTTSKLADMDTSNFEILKENIILATDNRWLQETNTLLTARITDLENTIEDLENEIDEIADTNLSEPNQDTILKQVEPFLPVLSEAASWLKDWFAEHKRANDLKAKELALQQSAMNVAKATPVILSPESNS